MMRCLLLTSFFCYLSHWAISQEYSYTHYDISDGLAGSTVYCITQDKDGFIWTGTETGVSRFDGKNFYNYTVVDGLPDVEMLEMFGDSRGRVWMAPFRKSICYYFKGKIHNQENDSLLHKVHLRDNVYRFAEDRAGNILMQESSALQMVTADGEIREFDSIAGSPIRDCGAVSRSSDGHFLVQAGNEVFELSEKGFAPFCPIHILDSWPGFIAMNPSGMIWRADSNRAAIRIFSTGKQVNMPIDWVHFRLISYTTVADSLYYFNDIYGATEYNASSGKTRRFLPGAQVSRTYRDATGNTWFTTLGQGIYRLNSDEFKTIQLKLPGTEASSISSLNKIGNHLLVGDDHNSIFDFSLPDLTLKRSGTLTGIAKNRILSVNRIPNGDYLVASEVNIFTCLPNFHKKEYLYVGVKSIYQKGDSELLVSAHWGVGSIKTNTLKVDTLWGERSTAVYYRKDTTYIGTLNGLFIMTNGRAISRYRIDIPFFGKRISAIAESADGTLWVASYDAGIVGFKDGQVIVTLTKQRGLTGDIVRTMLTQGSNLWVGTNKGLSCVRLDQPGWLVTQYTSQDGLGSDIINTICADGSVIYVGTPTGLSYFDDKKVDLSEGCRLYLLSVFNSGKERIDDTASLSLPFTDKHMRLEFAGISYRSVGGVTYNYRMLGLDTIWRSTRENFLEYQTLPSGKYELQLQAVNKFGTRSTMVSLPFTVATPFWQTAWFEALILFIFLSLVWLFVTLRIRQIHRRQTEKEDLNRRVTEMEHLALQAQMNPHFIFNCMNSIQQYIFDQDIFAANKYIAGFSRLIRSTLQNSTKPFITLPDEISYLSGYLSLEKLRFKEKMDYSIEVDNAVNDSKIIIPPMLIQPYVENSMRHGLRHKVDGTGHIRLEFKKSGDRLVVTVEDNGIGRKKAGSFKTAEHIEYQSKGMSLTAERIRMINSKYTEPILIDVIDLEDGFGRPMGTRVVMQLPFFHIMLEKEDL